MTNPPPTDTSLVIATKKAPAFKFAIDANFDKATGTIISDVPVEVADKNVHPSSFNRWCRRREVFRVLKQRLNIAVPRSKFDPRMKKLLEIGTAVHEHFRDTVLSEMMVGSWTCRKCSKLHGPLIKCPSVCENCGNRRYHCLWHAFRYEETKVTAADRPLTGSLDGFIDYRGKLRVAEIKSEREDAWKKRMAPSAGHVHQGHVYAGLAKHVLGVDVNSILVIYVNKTNGAMKAYLVPLSEQVFKWVMAEVAAVTDVAEAWAKTVNNAQDLLRISQLETFKASCPIVCKSDQVSNARSCPSRKECFNGVPKAKKGS